MTHRKWTHYIDTGIGQHSVPLTGSLAEFRRARRTIMANIRRDRLKGILIHRIGRREGFYALSVWERVPKA